MARPKDAWRGAAAAANSAPGKPGTKKAAGNTRRWLVAALVVLGLGGIIAGLFFFMRPAPDPVLLALPVTEYADPSWPANPWAAAEARNYGERFDETSKAFPDQEKARLLRALAQLAEDSKGTHKGRPIVAVLAIQGIAINGVPYLLPADAKPDDPSTWLKLDDVLQPLRKADVPRLLILDVRPVNSPHSIQPTSDVNDELDAALTKMEAANDLPFFVLNAATPAAGPAAIRPLKSTAFGLALNQAFGGHADGWNPERTKDDRVSVKELAAYVRETTYYATSAFGHPLQLPKLYGVGKDFLVRHVPSSGPIPLSTLADPEAVPAWLDESAKFHDAWVKGGGSRRLPKVAEQGNLARVQAEGQWLTGYDPAAIAARFAPQEQARRAAMASAPPVAPPTNTLARHRQQPEFAAKVAAAQTLLGPVFDKIRDNAVLKPDEFMAIQAPAWAKGAELPPEAICEAALKFAVALEDVKFEQIRRIASTVAGFRLKTKPAEWALFEFVAGFAPENVKDWPKGTLRRVVLLIPTTGEATSTDGRNLPWLQRELEAAGATANKALVTLGHDDSSAQEVAAAVPKIDEARALNVRIREAARVLSDTREQYEEARAELSDLGAEFPHEFAAIPADVASTWAALADAFNKAEALLATPEGVVALPALEPFNQTKDALLVARTTLRAMAKVPTDANVRQLERALAWPGWNYTDRTALFARYEQQSRASATKVLNSWPSAPSGLEIGTPAKAFKLPVKLSPLAAKIAWAGLRDEAKYQEWLGRTYYPRGATAWQLLKTDAAKEAARSLERIARDSLDWAAGANR